MSLRDKYRRFQDQISDFVEEFFGGLPAALIFFIQRNGTVVSAAAAFFGFLSIMPIILLMVSLLGYFFDDLQHAQIEVLGLAKNIFPNIAPWVLENIKSVMAGQASRGIGYINLFGTLFFSMAFFYTILRGLNIILSRKDEKALRNRLEALIGMTVTIVFSMSLVLVGPLSHIIGELINSISLIDQVNHYYPDMTDKLNFLSNLKIGNQILIFLKSDLINIILCFVYFTFLYHWLFSFKEGYRRSIFGAMAFSILFVLLKTFFWLYLFYARSNLVQNYGDFYTLIVVLIWMYFVMCSFYYGACVVHVTQKNTIVLEET